MGATCRGDRDGVSKVEEGAFQIRMKRARFRFEHGARNPRLYKRLAWAAPRLGILTVNQAAPNGVVYLRRSLTDRSGASTEANIPRRAPKVVVEMMMRKHSQVDKAEWKEACNRVKKEHEGEGFEVREEGVLPRYENVVEK